MDKIIILGTTDHSHMIRRIIEKEKAAEIVAYTINTKNLTQVPTECEGYPLVPFENIEEYYDISEYKILNTVGYSKMNEIRSEKNKECIQKGYELFSFVSKNAMVLSDVRGIGNIILPKAYVGTDVTLGDGNVIYTGSILTHNIDIGNNTFVAAGSTIGGSVVIGNNCFLGLNSTIKNSVNIADYTMVGASAYISKDTEKFGVYVPSRSIKLKNSSLDIRL